MTTEETSTEQVADAMMAAVRELILADRQRESLPDRLVMWASEVRQLGVLLAQARSEVARLGAELSDCRTGFADYRVGAERSKAEIISLHERWDAMRAIVDEHDTGEAEIMAFGFEKISAELESGYE